MANALRMGPQGARFEATLVPRRRNGWLFVVGVNLLVIPVGLAGSMLPTSVAKALAPVGLILYLVASIGLVALLFRTRKVLLDVDGHRLLVDEGRGGVFPLQGARLGPYRPAFGVVSGAALHLHDGARAYRIGGQDHRADAPPHAAAPVTDDVEVTLPLEPFLTLLAWVGFTPPEPGALPSPSVRLELAPNPSSPRTSFGNMLPWIGTIVLVSVVSAVLGATGIFDSGDGQYVGAGIVGAIVVGGLVLTMVRASRTGPVIVVEIDPREVRVRDARAGRVLASAPCSSVTRSRGLYRISMRGTTWEYPAVSLFVPGYGEITVAILDARFLWPDATPAVRAPRFIMGAPDWSLLVERLSLAPPGPR